MPMEGLQDEVQVGVGTDRAYQGAHWGSTLHMPGMQSDLPLCIRLQPPQEEDWSCHQEGQEMINKQDVSIFIIFKHLILGGGEEGGL